MNLKKLFNWNKKTEDQDTNLNVQSNLSVTEDNHKSEVSNVIPLMSNANEPQQGQINLESTVKLTPTKGLLNTPEIMAFFEENYYGLGRHNGSNFRTHDALDLGKRSLVSKFQNTLDDLLESKHTKINKLKKQSIAIEGLSIPMTQQLKQACEHLEREIEVLKHQISISDSQKGWVLEALNRYQIGFMKGVSDAIDFEYLAS